MAFCSCREAFQWVRSIGKREVRPSELKGDDHPPDAAVAVIGMAQISVGDEANGSDWRGVNRAHWDELVEVHLGPRGYDLADLRNGHGNLDVIVEGEHPPVYGKRVLHLQCHFGRVVSL
jgi:hypothetical protein